MEIERKFLVKELPDNLDQYPHDELCQAYVCTCPVIRVRKKNDDYILTLKSGGLLAREEIEMPIDASAFNHLKAKKEGMLISKTRYKIPEKDGLLIELDLFHEEYDGFCMAEVEFKTVDQANSYIPPAWFGKDVTLDSRFHNSRLCSNSPEEVKAFMRLICKDF